MVKNRVNKIITRLLGDPQLVTLEHRVFNATLLLVCCAGIISSIESVIFGIPVTMVLLTLAASLVSGAVYLIAICTGKWRILVFPTYLFFIGLLTCCWINQNGSSGGIGYFFFLLSGAAIVVFGRGKKLLALIVIAVSIVPLVLLEVYKPETIMPYASRTQRYEDVTFSLALCLLINGLMALFMFNEYQRERTAKNILIEDITREKIKVEKAVITKQRLLSMVSHDISNALFVVNNNLQDIKKSCDNDSKPLLVCMESAVTNICEIIESVRLLEANEAGRMAIETKRVDVADVLTKARSMFAVRLLEKNIRLDIDMPEKERFAVVVEPKIFCNHVLSNLLWNAIKFSAAGSCITMRAEKNTSEIIISVIDHGIGIPKHQISQLFLPGTKVGRQGTNGEQGTGLGLPVVKSFMELFNGRIQIESRTIEDSAADHGTTVRLFCQNATY